MQTSKLLTVSFVLFASTACSPSALNPPEQTQQTLAVAATTDGGLSARALIAQQLSREPGNMQPIARDDGVQQVRVVQGFRHATMAVRAADGSLVRRCVDNSAEALQLLDEAAR